MLVLLPFVITTTLVLFQYGAAERNRIMTFPNPRPVPGSAKLGNIVGDHMYFDDFHSGCMESGNKFFRTANTSDWLVTDDIDAAVTISDDEPGGVLRIATASNAGDFASCQLNGEGFKVTAGKDIYCEMRLKFDDGNDTRWFFGLATTDVTGTTLGPILDGVVESIGFRQTTATGTDIFALVEDGSAETTVDTGVNVVDDTFLVLAFHVLGTGRVIYWIDGKEVASFTTNIPSGDAITPSMEVQGPTATSIVEVDYFLCMQTR